MAHSPPTPVVTVTSPSGVMSMGNGWMDRVRDGRGVGGQQGEGFALAGRAAEGRLSLVLGQGGKG